MQIKHCGWNGEEYEITIDIGAEEGRLAFNRKQLRRVLQRARQACPRLRPKPYGMHVSSIGTVCQVKLTYKRAAVEKGFRTTASQRLAPLILAALQAKLPDL